MKKLTFILAFFLVSFAAVAQIEVSGTVTSGADNMSLPGVTVLEKGTSNGTITDVDGKYQITVGENAALAFSFVGYKTQEVEVNGQSTINVVLEMETTGIDEVIVVGYGVKKKSLVTGSISSVGSEELEGISSTRVDQAIQGRTAGVAILPTSGSPGAGTKIRIRGTNSNGNSNPLFIVDGMKTGDINNIDPGDIASIEVLKDAASSAIYGTEGGNGVILITTKSGKSGVSKINYDFSSAIQSSRSKFEVMNAEQYKTWQTETGNTVNDTYGADTDWLGELFQKAPMQKHRIGFSGGNEKTTYMVSGSYLTQDGIVGGDKANYNRYTARMNVKSDVKDWLQVGANFSFMHSDQKYIGEDDEYGGVVTAAILMDPLTPVYYDGIPTNVQDQLDAGNTIIQNADGKYYALAENVTGEIAHPLAKLETYHNSIKQDKILGSAYVTLKPIKGLNITSRIGLDLAYQNQKWWSSEYYFNSENQNPIMTIDDRINKWDTWLWENFASYTKTFGDHTVTAMAGVSAQKYEGPYYSLHSGPMVAYGDNFAYHSTGEFDEVASSMDRVTSASTFGRLSYDFGGKYLFEASIRRDGSSLFPPENKYGVFPAVSGGWTVSNEDFFNVDFIHNLKIRASWGANGSAKNLAGNEDIVFWSLGGIRYPDATGEYIYGANINKLPNPDLIWERTEMTDIGFDLRVLEGKLSLSVDYYNKLTDGLLAIGSGPLSVGNSFPTVNAGNIRNTGFDVELGFRNMDNEFKYGVNANFSIVDNNVEELLVDAPVRGDNLRGHDLTWFEQDYPIWYFKGYKTEGIDPATGAVNVVDVDEDGEITPADQTYIGDPHADLLFGGNLFASYKGFDFNLFFQGSQGNDIFMGFFRTDRSFSNKPAFLFEERWTADNTNATYPAATNSDDYLYRSDLMISDGSYVRIKQLQLGYTFAKETISKYGVNSLRAFISLDDYFTLTKYKGVDPEAGSSNNARQGIDRGLYPVAGKVMFGLSIGL